MIPIQRPRGKVRSWKEKVESVILSETLVLQVTRTLWPKTASKDQRKKWQSTSEIQILAVIKSQNKSKTTTG